MSHIRSKDTSPEIIVRSLVHRMGYRYALHRNDLPGHPDIVLVRHKKIIFVHGYFPYNARLAGWPIGGFLMLSGIVCLFVRYGKKTIETKPPA